MPRHRFYNEPQLVARATTDPVGQRCLDHAAEIARDPAIRALRLRLFAARNRTRAATIRARAIRPPPPPPSRRCYQAHRASDTGGDDDAR
jgi:hypothetical protein